MEKKEYVCGFMFGINKVSVLLIEKNRPLWQAGKLNGIGGKIEEEDIILAKNLKLPQVTSAEIAMIREFKEETGIITSVDDWELFSICKGDTSIIYNFRSFSDKIYTFKVMESEIPNLVRVNKLTSPHIKTVPNVQFLVPMALYTDEIFNINCQIKG